MHRPGGGKLPKSLVLTRRKETRRGRERGGRAERKRERWRKVIFYLTLCARQVWARKPRGVSDGCKEEEGGGEGGGVALPSVSYFPFSKRAAWAAALDSRHRLCLAGLRNTHRRKCRSANVSDNGYFLSSPSYGYILERDNVMTGPFRHATIQSKVPFKIDFQGTACLWKINIRILIHKFVPKFILFLSN